VLWVENRGLGRTWPAVYFTCTCSDCSQGYNYGRVEKSFTSSSENTTPPLGLRPRGIIIIRDRSCIYSRNFSGAVEYWGRSKLKTAPEAASKSHFHSPYVCGPAAGRLGTKQFGQSLSAKGRLESGVFSRSEPSSLFSYLSQQEHETPPANHQLTNRKERSIASLILKFATSRWLAIGLNWATTRAEATNTLFAIP
jgi:hypothetical protein